MIQSSLSINNSWRNERPIIGVLAQDIDSISSAMKGRNYNSYISASYVKFLESGGARVVPILIDQPDEYYQMIFDSINGMLIPGGAVDFDNSGKHDFTDQGTALQCLFICICYI